MKKKLLALALAWALSLAVLPSPALAAEKPYFGDEAEITHLEAVEAVVRLGIMWGKEDGSWFDPKGTVTRGEAAKVVAFILNGGEELSTPAGEPAFPDVKGHWAEVWINSCAEKGAAFPQDDGNFDPNGLIGRYDLLRMVEAALGYNDGKYDLTDQYWLSSVDSIAYSSGLYDLLPELEPQPGDMLDNTPLTRDETAYILYAGLNSAPYLGTEKRMEGDTLYFDKKYVTRPDGTPSTLLRENFGYDSWDDVPALPELAKPEVPKPKAQRGIDPTTLSDAKDVQYWEAVASLAQLGIISGTPGGSFDPAGNVTRAEAAKMIAVLMNGGSEANTGAKKEPTFTDIQGHWAEGWIEYCADMHIVSGAGDGSFDPDGQVTGVQFCKMALTALGYAPEAYHLTGESWATHTLELARKTDGKKLTEGLENVVLNAPVSREAAAQILYNALLATPIMIFPADNIDDGMVVWEYMPATGFDGQRETLLRLRFDLKEMPTVPVQPTT